MTQASQMSMESIPMRARRGQKNMLIIEIIISTKYTASAATLRKMDCQAWKRTYEVLLYGSTTRKMIAGINVMYAIAPAALSVRPDCGVSDILVPFVVENSVRRPAPHAHDKRSNREHRHAARARGKAFTRITTRKALIWSLV